MLHFQYERQRAVDNDLDEVCRHRLALRAINIGQRIPKVGAEARSMLAKWGWPCGLGNVNLSSFFVQSTRS